MSAAWEARIGLETHVQLRTRTKMFCSCPVAFGRPPNTLVCPVCLGYPGALPVANGEAIRLTVVAGLLLGCEIPESSKFDRKSYFYPDMPKNYQISQYDRPLCVGGAVEIGTAERPRAIRLTRIHLEEDVAKNQHFEASSGVDFNRAGTPLMEIVSEPEIETPEEAFAYLQALRQILLCGGVTDGNLEEGNLRCDVNVSVRRAGERRLGTKIEIKNMNTFRGVFRALAHEIRRQVRVLEGGGTIAQETRRWDDEGGATETMRTKEYAHDYRYFPDPDLLPVRLPRAQVERWRAELPELPAARRERFAREHGLPAYDAGVLVADKKVADFFEAVVRLGAPAKAASNWVMTEVLRALGEKEMEIDRCRLAPQALAALIALVERRAVNMPSAKEVFQVLFDEGGDPAEVVARKGLAQVSDAGAIEEIAARAIAANPRSVEAFRAGKEAALQHLVGQVMKLSRGKANPQLAAEVLRRRLG